MNLQEIVMNDYSYLYADRHVRVYRKDADGSRSLVVTYTARQVVEDYADDQRKEVSWFAALRVARDEILESEALLSAWEV